MDIVKPIDFEVEEGDGFYCVEFNPLGIYGAGETLEEAKQDALDMLESLYRSFVETTKPQSEASLEFAERLKEYCVKKEVDNA